MRIWLIKTGEPLSIDGDSVRVFRMGILAQLCADAGHDVTFWSSTFFHQQKRFRAREDTMVELAPNYRMRLVHTSGYTKNVSLARLIDHRQLEARFYAQARQSDPPDVILSAIPVPGLCRAAVRYGRETGVPVALDVRDLWPDVFWDLFPSRLGWLGRLVTRPIRQASRVACSGATAILGVTENYVRWGLDHAGREATSLDRVFPMGYSSKQPDEAAIAEAHRFWDGHGIRPGDDAFMTCFFGWLGHQFEIEPVIDAARLLEKEDRRYRFVLCGNGDNLERYRELSADLDNVLFPGFVGAAQIWTLMQMSSVGLAPYAPVPNFLKNLANKPIEYMSGGLPVIAGLRGVLAELLEEEDCGLTYESGNARHLADLLIRLNEQRELRERLARNSRRVFSERFVAEKVYAEMIDHLQAIASSGR